VHQLVHQGREDRQGLGEQRRQEEVMQAVARGLGRPAFADTAGAAGECAGRRKANRDMDRRRHRNPLGQEGGPEVVDGAEQPLLPGGGGRRDGCRRWERRRCGGFEHEEIVTHITLQVNSLARDATPARTAQRSLAAAREEGAGGSSVGGRVTERRAGGAGRLA
jgi:hypothetical protein